MPSSYLYKNLFDIEIDHLYYLNKATDEYSSMTSQDQEKQLKNYDILTDIDIIPTNTTAKLLKANRLVFRKYNKGIKVLSLTDPADENKPFSTCSDCKFTFIIIIKNTHFLNYTTIPLSKDSQRKTFYFNNRADGGGSTYPDLSLPAPDYASGSNYEMGSIIRYNGSLYEALINISSSASAPDTATTEWKNITEQAFINSSDKYNIRPALFNYSFSSEGINASVVVTDENLNTIYSETEDTDDNIIHQIDLRKSIPGKCTLEITNLADSSTIYNENFYLDNELYSQNVFGIIEIYGYNSSGNYRLLDDSGNFQSPVYKLRFKNRSTIWRYIDNEDRSILLESGPNPLTKKGFISVQLSGSSDDLPNPTVDIIKPEDSFIVSEIFINT